MRRGASWRWGPGCTSRRRPPPSWPSALPRSSPHPCGDRSQNGSRTQSRRMRERQLGFALKASLRLCLCPCSLCLGPGHLCLATASLGAAVSRSGRIHMQGVAGCASPSLLNGDAPLPSRFDCSSSNGVDSSCGSGSSICCFTGPSTALCHDWPRRGHVPRFAPPTPVASTSRHRPSRRCFPVLWRRGLQPQQRPYVRRIQLFELARPVLLHLGMRRPPEDCTLHSRGVLCCKQGSAGLQGAQPFWVQWGGPRVSLLLPMSNWEFQRSLRKRQNSFWGFRLTLPNMQSEG